MKKRFLINEKATSLWEELESEKSIKVVGGKSQLGTYEENKLSAEADPNDEGTILWNKNL